jgi:hypothetical protein
MLLLATNTIIELLDFDLQNPSHATPMFPLMPLVLNDVRICWKAGSVSMAINAGSDLSRVSAEKML